MRAIQFRGKCERDDSWVYGSLAIIHNVYEIIDHTGHNVYVSPNTVGQFTGLYDRNNTPIYEDDIIEKDDGSKVFVMWYDYSFVLMEMGTTRYTAIWGVNEWTVIGNLYDKEVNNAK